MRLLFITQKVDLDDDILGVYHDWISGVAKNLEQVSVICLYRGRVNLPENVVVGSLGKEQLVGQSLVGLNRFLQRLRYLVRFYSLVWRWRNEYDVVFVHMNPEYVVLAGLFWKLFHKKIILWYAHYLANFKLRVAAALADRIMTSTRLAYPLDSKKLVVLQQGIDTEMFKSAANKKISPQFKILWLGRFAPVKNLEILLAAFAEVARRLPQATLTIIGGPTAGKSIEAAYYKKISNLVNQIGLADRIVFWAPVPHSQTPDIYRDHDLFINLTDTGSFDKTTLEAMACGVPVLVSNRAFAELFSNTTPELLCKEKDLRDLADKILAIQALSIAQRRTLGEKLRQLIIQHHDLRQLTKRLADIIRQI